MKLVYLSGAWPVVRLAPFSGDRRPALIGSYDQSLAGSGDHDMPRAQASAGDETAADETTPFVLIIEDDFFVASHLEAV